jgi:ABC-type nitrate/sulfonate/bicarbonate transport system substrate-binding protein
VKRAAALCLTAGFTALRSQSAGTQELIPLRAIGAPNDGFKAMHYGARSGLFARYGLNVTVTSVNNGAASRCG